MMRDHWIGYEIVEDDKQGGFIVWKMQCRSGLRVVVAERRVPDLSSVPLAIRDMNGFSHEELGA